MELSVTADPASVGRCRHWASYMARQLGARPPAIRTIELLTSELVTNAVKFGPAGGRVVLSIRRLGEEVTIAVRDASPARPVVRTPGPEDIGGRGMLFVERLAGRWGVDPHAEGGKSVWFTVGVQAS